MAMYSTRPSSAVRMRTTAKRHRNRGGALGILARNFLGNFGLSGGNTIVYWGAWPG